MLDAFRQLPVFPEHRPLNAGMWSTFGCQCFLRFPTFALALEHDGGGAQRVLSTQIVGECLKIRLEPSSVNQNQMAIFTSMLFGCTNRITFEPVSGVLQRLAQEVQAWLSQGSCASAQAAELRGRAGWALTVFFARAVRQALALVIWTQYQNCHHAQLTPGLLEALTFLVTGMLCIPPRLFEVFQPAQVPTLAYRDASWPDPAEAETNPPRFGWLFLEPGTWNLMVPKLSPRS